MDNIILINKQTVHQLRPVETKSKVELRLDVHLPDQSRRESRSKSTGSIGTTGASSDVCTLQEPVCSDLTRVNCITVTFSYAEGSYHYPFFGGRILTDVLNQTRLPFYSLLILVT